MIVKICEFCGKEVNAQSRARRFCNDVCQRKHYYRRPEVNKRMILYSSEYNQRPYVKKRNRDRIREYRRSHPEWKEKHRLLARKYKEKRARYWKEYGKRPEVRERLNMKEKIRRQTDIKFAIEDRLRRSLNHALTKYTQKGKIMSSKKYGINWEKVIISLKPFPENIKNYEIDHIMPLRTFNPKNPWDVKKAFDPSNLQWLTKEENRRKSGKLII